MRGALSRSPSRLSRTVRLAVAFIASLAAMDGAGARPLDEVVAAKVLKVVAYLDNAPFSFEADGVAKGIEPDLARAIARELGVEAQVILRMQGEKADDDLRANVWRGPLTGGELGDLMMHVPIDREFALRNKEAVIGNAYFEQRVAVAIHRDMTGENPGFDVFKTKKIGVQIATVADYFLMTYQDGALINNVAHHVKAEAGAKEFARKDVAALMGVRSKIESLLAAEGIKPVVVEPDMTGIIRSKWQIGMAWKDNSRDLGYAVEAALKTIVESGEMQRICATHGVVYTPPPPPQ